MGKHEKDRGMSGSGMVHMATGEDIAFSTQELPFICVGRNETFKIGITLTTPESNQMDIDKDDITLDNGWSFDIYLGPIFISIGHKTIVVREVVNRI